MLATMCDRGPDSAGFAVYGDGKPGSVKLTLRAGAGEVLEALLSQLAKAAGGDVAPVLRDTHMTITRAGGARGRRARGAGRPPARHLASSVGGQPHGDFQGGRPPDTVATRFGLAAMHGTHAIGHTRMATESAVTTDGAHPFTTGPDQCLVHNGSLSNHNAVRRTLQHEGLSFETDNDSEVAAGYLTWRMREGAVAGRCARGVAGRPRRLLHLRGRHRDWASACCAIRSPASRR